MKHFTFQYKPTETGLVFFLMILFMLLALTASAQDYVWAKSMGSVSDDRGNSMVVDSEGNVYTIGLFTGTVDFDPGAGTLELTSAGNKDIFVSKLDKDGNLVWARNMGGSGYDAGISIAVDAGGNVYTTGSFSTTADFDPGAGVTNLVSAGGLDLFISKLDGMVILYGLKV